MREIIVDYVSIGRRIRAKRLELRMTQEQLGEVVNLSTTHISHIETGNTKLSFESFVSISNALQVSADELLQDNLKHNEMFYRSELADMLSECSPDEMKSVARLVHYCMEMIHSK